MDASLPGRSTDRDTVLGHGIRMTVRIANFFAGKSVLVTGATGFMGKVLVEKLLRSCPELRTLHVLLRPKRGQTSAARVEDFINCQIFDRIRDEHPAQLQKIHLVAGDVLKAGLGLSPEDKELLEKECQVVFHCAACVRFDQKLKDAVNMNTGGTNRVLELTSQMKKIEVFLHVSTAYCHCHLDVLEERVYPSLHRPHHVLQLVNWMDDNMLEQLTPKMIGLQPNTYAYTKNLTEELVASHAQTFPVAIARPSIVTSGWKEPIPGWVENLNGPTGLLVGAGKGVIRSMHCEPSYTADMVPVDMVINACILLAVTTAIDKPKEVRVCNITESGVNPLTWGAALEIGRNHVAEYPFSMCLWYPGGSIKSSWFVHQIAHIFTHLLPAYFIDLLLFLLGKKPFMVKVQSRISTGLEVLQYYTTKQWKFVNSNLLALRHRLEPAEDEVFYTDLRPINWSEYLKDYILGAREYCCKEDPATLPSARRLRKKLFVLDLVTQLVVGAVFVWLVLSRLPLMLWALDALGSMLARLSPFAKVMADEL